VDSGLGWESRPAKRDHTMKRRREEDDVWSKEDRAVRVWKRERESVDKRDGTPACIWFFVTIAPI
jgi:hypothetical protein